MTALVFTSFVKGKLQRFLEYQGRQSDDLFLLCNAKYAHKFVLVPCAKNLYWHFHVVIGTRHYSDAIMGAMASQITSLTSTVFSGADQRKHQSSASLAFVRGIHRWSVNSPHKWPVTLKMFPFDDGIIYSCTYMHEASLNTRTVGPLRAIFCIGKLYLQFMSLFYTEMIQAAEILPRVRQELTYSMVNMWCWCTGNAMSQGISSNDIDCVEP